MPSTFANDFLTKWSFRLFLLGAFLIPATRLRAGGIQVSDLIFVISIILLAFSKKQPDVEPMAFSWHLALFLVVVGGIGATINSLVPTLSLLVVVRMVFVLLYWPWVARHLLITQGLKHIAMYAFVLGCAASGFLEILQSGLHILTTAAAGGRAIGFTTQPDELGACLALGLVFAIGLLMELGSGKHAHRLISVLLIAIGLILSASVSAQLSALAGVFVLLVLRKVNMRRVLTGIIVIVVVYLAGTALLGGHSGNLNPISRFEATVGNSSSSNTGSLRIDTFKAAWHGIADAPVVGHGLDQVSGVVYWQIQTGAGFPAHNIELIIWYQGGILFLIGTVIAVVAAFWRVSGVGRRDPTKDIIFAGGVASLIYAQTAPIIFQTYFWLPFVLAMTYTLARRPSDAPVALPGPSVGSLPVSAGSNGAGRLPASLHRFNGRPLA